MKFVAAIVADLEWTPLRTRSRLAEDLCGRTVLRRCAERVARAKTIASIRVLCPVVQEPAVIEMLRELPVATEPHDAAPPPYAELVRAGRIWGLDGWRGGLGSLCAFDEYADLPLLHFLATREQADAIVLIPGAAPVIDPALIDAMTDHYARFIDAAKITFAQTPPGLAPVILGREMLEEWAPTAQPPGLLLTYHPDRPIADLTGREPCYRPAAQLIEASGRLVCDTRRSFERVRGLIAAGGDAWPAERVGAWLGERRTSHVDDVPREIEIELTTDDPAPNSILRPRGAKVGRRGPLDLATIRRVIDWIADHDDVRIVLGGFGEPCLHPKFVEICRMLRESPAAAIAVRTSGLVGDAIVEAALFETPVDVVEVTLDAARPETYARVHGLDAYEAVMARLERWMKRRIDSRHVRPLIFPSFIKAKETLDDMEDFFDGWHRRLGMAVVTGSSHYAGQLPDRSVTPMAPPGRGPCRRVFSRAMILADGRITTCDQDFAGRQAMGNILEQPPAELWCGEGIEQVRRHCVGQQPLCPGCDEWHRP